MSSRRTNEVDETSAKNKVNTEKCNLFVAYKSVASKRAKRLHTLEVDGLSVLVLAINSCCAMKLVRSGYAYMKTAEQKVYTRTQRTHAAGGQQTDGNNRQPNESVVVENYFENTWGHSTWTAIAPSILMRFRISSIQKVSTLNEF